LHNGPVLGAVSVIDGVVMVAQGSETDMFNAATGNKLFAFTDSRPGSAFLSGAAVAEGMVFQGNQDGYLYTLGL
jgi:outer membrane protein assembly factor BamB